ncbi:MAG TPA: GlsB/YeaQ/YmgE family stress response membrane protein [Polyangiaceae bacterium]|nr:GlsB/YeaQ/YmgE family stress response membrane protein [Polyangiaceae bacterium]
MSIVLFMILGALVGITTHCFVQGWQRGGWLVSIALGIFGAGLGAFFGLAVGLYGAGDPVELFASVGGAVLVLVAYHTAAQRRRWHERGEIR